MQKEVTISLKEATNQALLAKVQKAEFNNSRGLYTYVMGSASGKSLDFKRLLG